MLAAEYRDCYRPPSRSATIPPVVGLALFGLAAAAVIALLLITRNANRLLVAVVRDGRIVRFRGHAPQGLLRDLGDVMRQRPVRSARLSVHVRDGAAVMAASGDVMETELQRCRNVLGTWPLAKIRAAPYRSVG